MTMCKCANVYLYENSGIVYNPFEIDTKILRVNV